MHATSRFSRLLSAYLFSSLLVAAQDAPADEPAAPPDVTAALHMMAESISAAVERKDTDHPVFHGCIDWHSAVHGHWALLCIARVTSEHDDSAAWVLASLDPEGIAEEADHLGREPDFEMPYGRAWFLRLAIEYEQRDDAPQQPCAAAMSNMADEVAASLLQYCESRELSPRSREYGNEAWALTQLHAFYAHRRDEPNLERADALVSKFFVDSDARVRFAADHRRPDFFSPFGNWAYLLAKTQSAEAADRFWQAHRPADDELRPVDPQSGAAHHLGVNWSRAWALRAVGRVVADPVEQTRLSEAYNEHIAAGLVAHFQHKADYGAYGHWVPQFAVYALTE
jgi:hypothetical protein